MKNQNTSRAVSHSSSVFKILLLIAVTHFFDGLYCSCGIEG